VHDAVFDSYEQALIRRFSRLAATASTNPNEAHAISFSARSPTSPAAPRTNSNTYESSPGCPSDHNRMAKIQPPVNGLASALYRSSP
jgi:hypothetical protein